MQGVVEGRAVVVGRASFLADWSQHAGRAIWLRRKEAAEADGKTVVVVGWDGAVRGLLVVADTIKDVKRRGRTPDA